MALRRAGRIAVAVALVAAVTVSARWSAEPADAQQVPPADAAATAPAEDNVELGPDYNDGKPVPLDTSAAPPPPAPAPTTVRPPTRSLQSTAPTSVAVAAAVGSRRSWPSLDTRRGLYLKEFTLRAVGNNVEVWVATGSDGLSSALNFPAGDCRNDARVQVTDAQVAHLVREFDSTILPVESDAFSVATQRGGGAATLPALIGLPQSYYTGEGDNAVLLVDNVRDENFYDPSNGNQRNYVAGFYYSEINDYTDRNVVTLDGYDWLHRTGQSPPHQPGDSACGNMPARPWFVEGILAHEYQHLLHNETDPGEALWVNEGLSDWAQTLTGYASPSIPVTQTGFDSHVQCMLGWLGTRSDANPLPATAAGPENSLTLWEDQGAAEELCDYGAAYTFMEYLDGRFGQDLLTGLHNDPGHGLTGLQRQLEQRGADVTVAQLIDDWSAMLALDQRLDTNNGNLLSDIIQGLLDLLPLPLPQLQQDADAVRTPTLSAEVRWDTQHAYATPGAPPNGTDFIRLRAADGRFLRANEVRSLNFDGADTHPSQVLEWTTTTAAPGQAGDAALASGSGSDLDRTLVRQVTVPQNATLTFNTRFQSEAQFDFGFVQVSGDGGATWTTLPSARTRVTNDPNAHPSVRGLPGLTGDSQGWVQVSYDLSQFRGRQVLLGFRYVTDFTVARPGWWIDDVTLGGQVLSDGATLDGWQSATQVHATPVAGFSLQVVAYSSTDPSVSARLGRIAMSEGHVASPSLGELRGILRDSRLDVVGLLVTSHDPTERETGYVPYTLSVNGVLQPGG